MKACLSCATATSQKWFFTSNDDCILYMKFETTKEKSCVLVVGGRCVCKIKGRIVNKKKDRKTSWITKCLVYDDGLKGMKSCDFALLFSILYTNKKNLTSFYLSVVCMTFSQATSNMSSQYADFLVSFCSFRPIFQKFSY